MKISEFLKAKKNANNAMQKMAVIEHQKTDNSGLLSTPIYQRIQQYLNEGRSMQATDWAELTDAVNNNYNGFCDKLYSLYHMSNQDLHVSMLIKIRIQPKDIATLTAHSKESIASTRSRLYKKIFDKKGSTKDWDDFILSI